MGEGGGGVGATVKGFMSPGIGIVTSWQGIVEIVLRGVIIVLALIMAAAGGSCQTSVAEIPPDAFVIQGLTASAAGWIIFVGAIIIIYEIVVIIQRFLNITIINNNITIVIIIDAVASFVVAFLIFCAAVALAAYNPQWQDVRAAQDNGGFFSGVLDRVIGATGAAAAFGFLTMFALIGLGVYMILGGLVFNWGPTKAKYSTSSGGSSGAV